MTVTTEDRGRQNMFAREPRMYVSDSDAAKYALETHAERAEKMNGRFAMVGLMFAFLSYGLTGNLLFGVI